MEPIAKRLKQSAVSVLHTTTKQEDLTEQIRHLEAELANDGSDNDDDSDSSSSFDIDSDAAKNDKKADNIVNLSAFATERIESLPDSMLPVARPLSMMLPVKKKCKKTLEEENKQAATKTLELLNDALTFPKKLPFACKSCKFIGKNMDDFKAHQASKEHLESTKSEEKALQCVVCNKSFTSQAQVDEHRAGKWHKQRVQQKRERHTVKVCYDFMRGECKWGDRCYFEHKETKAMRSGKAFEKIRRQVCGNFVQGKKCRFGDKCLFSHDTK